MRVLVCLFVVLLPSPTVFAQAKTHKAPVQVSHRQMVLYSLDLADVQFKVSCARTADHASNQQCVNQMLRDLQANFSKLGLQEIPIPKRAQSKAVVFVFKEEALMDDDTITLTVYETENNDEVYSDSGSVLILKNDLTKLIASYVEYLDSLDSEARDAKD